MKKRVLVIGLDGATWKNLDPLIQTRKMSFLASLKKKGASGVLKSIIPPLTPPAWTSFQTGANPGTHGVFDFLNYRVDPLFSPPLFNSGDIKSTKIWQYLGRLGLESLVINMPLAYPLEAMNGILISSFLTPKGKDFVYPNKYTSLLKKVDYKLDSLERKARGQLPKMLSSAERKHFVKQLLEVCKKRVVAFERLSSKGDFSFIFLLFKETDVAQHVLYGTAEMDLFYVGLDKLLKRACRFFEKNYSGDKSVIFISDHGFHQAANQQFSPFAWLIQNGYLRQVDDVKAGFWRLASRLHQVIRKTGFSLTDQKEIKKARQSLVSQIEKEKEIQMIEKFGIRVSFQGIYFLDQNRWPLAKQRKIVQALADYQYQGKKVFQKVALGKNTYRGPFTSLGPNIVWLPTEDFVINVSPLSMKIVEPRPTHLLGDHAADRNGIFLASGNQFLKKEDCSLKLVDIFPLICVLLGQGVAEGLDGQVPDCLKAQVKASVKSEKEAIEEMVEKSIKALGQ